MALMKLDRDRSRSGLARLHNEMDTLFNSFFGGLDFPQLESIWPALELTETADAVKVQAELPGCKIEDIDISVHGNNLVISGEKKQTQEKKGEGYYQSERVYGSFRREIMLPTEVEAGKVDAAYKDGILSITVPKAERTKPVKVKIKEQ